MGMGVAGWIRGVIITLLPIIIIITLLPMP